MRRKDGGKGTRLLGGIIGFQRYQTYNIRIFLKPIIKQTIFNFSYISEETF